MIALMLPASSFAAGPSVTTYLLIAAVTGIALASALPANQRKLVKAAALALGGAVIANLMVPCQYYWFC